jgi:RHS repeat-associated protein
MVGISTADLKGVRNDGASGTAPLWSMNADWDMLSAPGGNARPALADLDNDGDLDLLVGFADGRYRSWENTGSRQAPQWQPNTSWPPNYDIGGYAAPTLADLDGDGDLDILSGNSAGQLEAYRNTGDAESPGPWVTVVEWSDDLPDVGVLAAPALGDLDGDGIPDLLIGISTGKCLAFRNTGTVSTPHWAAIPVWDVPDDNQNNAVPALADLDGDGDLDLLVGDHYYDHCVAYENTGGPSAPAWTRRNAWDVSISGYYTAPAVGDLDHEWALGIFSDGFESGNASAWSDHVGKSMEADAWGDIGWGRALDRENTTGNAESDWSEYSAGRGVGTLGAGRFAETERTVDPALRSKKNPLSDDSFGYVFNAADQMTRAYWQYGTIEDYEYDGDDLRLRKTTAGDEVVYIRDATGNVLAEYDGANTLLAEYVYANGRQVAKVEPGAGEDSFRFFHSDQLGTALVVTDDSGAVTWRGEYYPFGEEYSSEGTPNQYRFTERETDQATGLTYMRARYYNPHLGRFLTVDPVGGKVGSSQSWNRYSYVLNNPVRHTDPTGMITDVPNTMTGETFGGKPLMVGDATPEQRALSHAILTPLIALPFVPLASPSMLTGGGIGLVTSLVNALGSDAPIDKKVDAVLVGTGLGAVLGPFKVRVFTGAASAIGSRNATDAVTGEGITPLSEDGREGLNGAVAGAAGSLAPDPVSQMLVSGAVKLLLDLGTSAFEDPALNSGFEEIPTED